MKRSWYRHCQILAVVTFILSISGCSSSDSGGGDSRVVIDGSLSRTYTSYDSPRFEGYVKNTGDVTVWNVKVAITCYSDSQKRNIIDVANGFPANLGDIRSGQRAYFEAIAFDCDSHSQIAAYDIRITWLDRD